MQYTLKNTNMQITVADLGAELISVIKDGKERIWQNPTGEWAGHAPLLFPVCGHCGVTVDGVAYPIGLHGVARKSVFTLIKQTDNALHFVLTDNEQTKKVFPFAFVFEVVYRLDGDTLSIQFIVKNPAETPLYFACGSHESYALEGNVDEYQVEFDTEEKLTHRPHNAGGYLTGEKVDYGVKKVLDLPREVLQNGDTLIFENVQSRKVRLVKKGVGTVAEITFEGFGNLLFWRGGDAEYICIEPWTNLPDLADIPDIEFSTKAGVMKLGAGEEKTLVRTIKYL
jgi:galactose mutarotase-like enzyme